MCGNCVTGPQIHCLLQCSWSHLYYLKCILISKEYIRQIRGSFFFMELRSTWSYNDQYNCCDIILCLLLISELSNHCTRDVVHITNTIYTQKSQCIHILGCHIYSPLMILATISRETRAQPMQLEERLVGYDQSSHWYN